MVIWLVMVMLNTVAPIHVGNFNSLDACEKAAQAAVQINPKGINARPLFTCVQANETGTANVTGTAPPP